MHRDSDLVINSRWRSDIDAHEEESCKRLKLLAPRLYAVMRLM